MGTVESSVATAPAPRGMSVGELAQSVVRSKAFVPGLVVTVGIFLVFWPLLRMLPGLWAGGDGYYSHGFLIPAMSAFIIFRRWPKLKQIPVQTGWLALVLVIPLFFILRAAHRSEVSLILSMGLIMTMLFGIWFAAGHRWMLALSVPVLYLLFALPIWTMAIDVYTNPLQMLSTKVAYQMLQLGGFNPYQHDPTTIYLSQFVLDVGVPCSGLKLVLAVSAFTMFFIMIANLKAFGNLLMLAIVLPLCLFVNGVRIALIGVVGDMYGSDAGMAFHDYSGYIMLLLCFFILFKFARLLGWKD
jgi:exosortase